MELKEIKPNEKEIEELINLSILWEKEDITFGYRKNDINDIIKISHVYKIEVHGKDVLWINDNNIIIGLNDINKFEIW